MQFFKATILLGLAGGICATPVPNGAGNEIIQRRAALERASVDGLIIKKREDALPREPLYDFLHVRAAGKTVVDYNCPTQGNIPTNDIKDALAAGNAKANPKVYGNGEGFFNTPKEKKLYEEPVKTNRGTIRAIWTRSNNNSYEFRGVLEHPPGLSNGFVQCHPA